MKDAILTIDDLHKSFGDFTAVNGVSFEVGRGEIFSLLGPNGAGKTTTISMLSCLLRPTAGDATIDSHSITNNPLGVKRVIGVVPQELALYESLTAQQNLMFWGRMYDMGGKELTNRVAELLEQVELTDRAKDRVETFSGGMKRRLNIAVGLLHKPQLVFMDEPTVGIDPQSRRRILNMVKDLRDEGMTLVYTTHYMEEAEELSDRVGIIDQGKLIAIGTQKELTKLVGEQEGLRLAVDEGVDAEAAAAHFSNLEGVVLSAGSEGEIVLTVRDSAESLPAIITTANEKNIRIRGITISEPNLEAVFLHLTGRALRD